MKMRFAMGVAAALCTSGLAMGQSANNDCINAPAILVDTPVTTTIVAADTNDGPTNTSTNNGCTATIFAATNRTVWYTFTPTTTGLHEVSLCASTFDTLMGIYPASSTTVGAVAPCSGTVAALACNDDSCGTRSNFNVNLTAGQGYIIRVSPFGTGSGGTYTLLVHGPQSTPAPANDECTGAIALTSGSPTAGDLTNATGTSTTLSTCPTPTTTGNDVWYTVTSTSVTGTASVDVCGNFDTALNVYTAASTCGGTFTSLSCNDDTLPTGCTLHGSRVTWTAAANTTYYVRVAGVQHSTSSPSGIAPAHGLFTITATVPAPTGSCCVGFCCSVTTQAACTGTWTLAGTCTAGVTCGAHPNDECGGAVAMSLNTAVTGTNCGATKLVLASEPAPTCQTNFNASLWYSFAPATTGLYTVTACGSSFDTVVDVLTSPDCATYTSVACDDDTCDGVTPAGSANASFITQVQLNAGTLYYVRLSGWSTSTGNFTLTVTENTVAGACCNPTTGACTISNTGAAGCTSPNTFSGGVCSPNPCPQPSGACCNNDGTCSIVAAASCTGVFQGPATTCGAGDVCPVEVGSCCNSTTGVCTYILASATCSGGVFTSGGVCSPNTCPQPGACCIGSCCTVTLQAACTGVWGPANSTCTVGFCGSPVNDTCATASAAAVGSNLGTNCGASTDFAVTPASQCGTTAGAGGARDVWHSFTPTQSANYTFSTCTTPGFDTVLALYEACPADGNVAPRACNDDTAGTCAISTLRSEIPNQLLIAGQTYYIRVAAWAGGTAEGAYDLSITQGAAAGACCNGSTCTVELAANCTGVYQGDFGACTPTTCDPAGACCATDGSCSEVTQSACTGTFTAGGVCTPNPCPQPNGACCCGSTCSVTASAACTGTNQFFAGAATVCNVFGVDNTTPCCFADFNQSGAVSVQDIFDFLAGYFGGDGCTDINASGGAPSVQDIFDYLATYFAGCV